MKPNRKVDLADKISETESKASSIKRPFKEAAKVLEKRLDDMVIENYDSQFQFEKDRYDELTNTKTHGFYD